MYRYIDINICTYIYIHIYVYICRYIDTDIDLFTTSAFTLWVAPFGGFKESGLGREGSTLYTYVYIERERES